MSINRRSDRLGIHSIGEFCMTVPSLEDAHRFYTSFGLDVQADGDTGLVVRTFGSPHVWGRLRKGARKKFEHLTLHCFAEDLEALKSHVQAQGVALISAPTGGNTDGFWIRNPDGMPLHICAGAKTTIDQAAHQSPPLPVDGTRCASYRRNAKPVRPTRLSHIALMSSSVSAQVAFSERVLGLRLSDRSGEGIAFLHAPHGSDHHLLAFAGGSGMALHHLSWDVPTVEEVGLGRMQMNAAGFTDGWGVGRHVLGSNYFYYAMDPWGSFCEYSATMDYIPANVNWEGQDHRPEDGLYLWGPDLPHHFLLNSEQQA